MWTIALIDTSLASLQTTYTDSDDPSLEKLLKLSELPMCTKSTIEMADASLPIPNTLKLLPSLAKHRRDIEEPTSKEPRTETQDPKEERP
jgi:hypothetical protein